MERLQKFIRKKIIKNVTTKKLIKKTVTGKTTLKYPLTPKPLLASIPLDLGSGFVNVTRSDIGQNKRETFQAKEAISNYTKCETNKPSSEIKRCKDPIKP